MLISYFYEMKHDHRIHCLVTHKCYIPDLQLFQKVSRSEQKFISYSAHPQNDAIADHVTRPI